MSTYDAIDALIYLNNSAPLDWAAEYLAENLESDEYADAAVSAIYKTTQMIRDELSAVYDGRTSYSNGSPFHRTQLSPHMEPNDDGTETPVVGEMIVPQHPAHMVGPFDGGVWKDEATA